MGQQMGMPMGGLQQMGQPMIGMPQMGGMQLNPSPIIGSGVSGIPIIPIDTSLTAMENDGLGGGRALRRRTYGGMNSMNGISGSGISGSGISGSGISSGPTMGGNAGQFGALTITKLE